VLVGFLVLLLIDSVLLVVGCALPTLMSVASSALHMLELSSFDNFTGENSYSDSRRS
jgi:hypothetical protein